MSGSLLPTAEFAANAATKAGFSFAACGDTRPMMFLPENAGEPDLVKLFVEMFGLVMPERVAEEVVKKYVKMIFDPDTKELIQVVMPFMTKTEVMTLTVDKGWVTEASVEDIKLLPGVHRTMFRLEGGEWVARRAWPAVVPLAFLIPFELVFQFADEADSFLDGFIALLELE